MAKASKLVAVFSHSRPAKTQSGKSYVYVLDGTPEQHQQYLDSVDMKYQPEDGFADKQGKLPELKGNPTYSAFDFKGVLVELAPDEDGIYRVNSAALDEALDMATLTGENKANIVAVHTNSLKKYRASVKDTVSETDEIDGLE